MKLFVMDKTDRKYLLWFLIGVSIAVLPWIILS